MPRIYLDKNEINGSVAVITGEDAKHISRSLRMKLGDEVTVCDGEMTDYKGVITGFTSDTVQLEITSKERSGSEAPYKARLFMALPKSDKMELIIQKAVELGVYQIVPFLSERCISRPDGASGVKKVERWNKIALGAAQQSGRGIIPTVHGIVSYKEALEMAKDDEARFICYECEEENGLYQKLLGMNEKEKCGRISFFVGAEGGFSREEVELAKGCSIASVTLGKRILRCETAPMFVLSVMSAVLNG